MIPGVILAGGASSRMSGRPKALLPLGSDPQSFLSRIVQSLRDSGVDDVIVVAGYHLDEITRHVEGQNLPVRIVPNPHPEQGQLSSLLAGLRAVDHPGVQAMLVTLVDLPLIASDTARAVLDAYRDSCAPLVRPARSGRHGHPVLFDRRRFDERRHADPERGAKSVVRAHAAEGVEVEVNDNGAFDDIDTPADYQRVFGQLPV